MKGQLEGLLPSLPAVIPVSGFAQDSLSLLEGLNIGVPIPLSLQSHCLSWRARQALWSAGVQLFSICVLRGAFSVFAQDLSQLLSLPTAMHRQLLQFTEGPLLHLYPLSVPTLYHKTSLLSL